MANLQEFAFGTSPKRPDATQPIRPELVNGYLELSWNQRAGPLDAVVEMEQAHRLEGPWFGGPGTFEFVESVPSEPGFTRVRFRSRLPWAQVDAQFARLKISLVP